MDLHKRNLRRKKRRRLEHTKSVLSTASENPSSTLTNSACQTHSSAVATNSNSNSVGVGQRTNSTSGGGNVSTNGEEQHHEQLTAQNQLAALAASGGGVSGAGGASLVLIGGTASSAAGLPIGVKLPPVASYTNILATAAGEQKLADGR